MNEDKAARYQRLGRRVRLLSLVAGVALLLILVASGLSVRLRDLAALLASAGATSASTAAVYVLICAAMASAVMLPLACYRTFILDRRFGLSSAPFSAWCVDYLKACVLLVLITVAAVQVIHVSMRVWPQWWWIPAAAVFGAALVAATRFAALALLRVFHRIEPLDRTSLRQRLLALSARARVRVIEVLVLRLGGRTSRANAALLGLGGARRIVVSDTLLENFSDAEIEVVLAHEMGHHVNGDVLRIVALEMAVLTSALAAGALCLTAAWRPLGLAGPADAAGLPLVVMGAVLVSCAARPGLNALSRRFERRADRFALELTNHPAAFISTMRRFAANNLAEERPSRWTLWMFHTHPAVAERIRVAKEFQASG